MLAIGGWADAYVNAPPALAANLAAPAKALMGPWEHKYPHIAQINAADFHGEVVAWFDRWLRGEGHGAEDLPAYRAFMQEHHEAPSPRYGPRSGRWIAEAVWPSPTVVSRTLHPETSSDSSPHRREPASSSDAQSPGPHAGRLSRLPGIGDCVVATPHHVGIGASCFCPGMRIDNELAADQAPDDAASVCFDTRPLGTPLELLGRPVMEFAFSADRPVAQLCFRLCDVAPDGASQRITWRAFNLTHHAGPEAPAALRPGRIYRARVELNECAHRVRAGHRLRLAVSTSYWPVVWPAPVAATVTLRLAGCRLILPERRAVDEIDPAAPGAPSDFPVHAAETLRAPANRTERRIDADGAHVLETFDDFGASRDLEHELESGSHVEQRYSIHSDDPLSARHEARWRYEFGRGDWSVRIDSESVMTSDEESFHLDRAVTAREGDAVVISLRWKESIPRGLL